MGELLRTRIQRTFAQFEVDTKSCNRTIRLVILYSCRFVGSRIYRKGIKWIFPENLEIQNNLISLKEDLDYSTYRNAIFRIAYAVVHKKPSDIKELRKLSKAHGMEVEDAKLIQNMLTDTEKRTLAARPDAPGIYNDKDVADLIKHVDPIIRRLVYTKLAFVFNNDASMDHRADDLIDQLRTQAMKVIREYEVQNITDDHMVKNVVCGLKNHTANLAESYGRRKRRSVARISRRDKYRKAWYLNIHDYTITQVNVSDEQKFRVQSGGVMRVMVEDCDTRTPMLVHLKRLYETFEEATTAAELNKKGKYSKRDSFISLSPQNFDEFQKTCKSMFDQDENGNRLIDKLPSDDFSSESSSPLHGRDISDLITRLGPKARKFAELVLNPEEDEFFAAWAIEQGEDVSSLDVKKLGNLACAYLGISKQRLKTELTNTMNSLWEESSKSLLAGRIRR